MSNNVPMRYWPYEDDAKEILSGLEALRLKMKEKCDALLLGECYNAAKRYSDAMGNLDKTIRAFKK